MTCIVAVRRADGGITMAADRCVTDDDDDTRQVMAEPKIFDLGEMLIGAAGYCRPGQVIQYHVEVAPLGRNGDPLTYLRRYFAPAVAQALDEHGCRWDPASEHSENDFTLLIALRGRIFTMTQRLSVDEYREPYAAIGSGRMLALGALAAVWARTDNEIDVGLAGSISAGAIRIAAQFDPGVDDNIDVEHQLAPFATKAA